jgi:hypothetical protein
MQCQIKKQGVNMDDFCKRIDREMNSIDRHERDQERLRYIRREMAREYYSASAARDVLEAEEK